MHFMLTDYIAAAHNILWNQHLTNAVRLNGKKNITLWHNAFMCICIMQLVQFWGLQEYW